VFLATLLPLNSHGARWPANVAEPVLGPSSPCFRLLCRFRMRLIFPRPRPQEGPCFSLPRVRGRGFPTQGAIDRLIRSCRDLRLQSETQARLEESTHDYSSKRASSEEEGNALIMSNEDPAAARSFCAASGGLNPAGATARGAWAPKLICN